MFVNAFNRYTCIKQFDTTDCAAACLATISKHYGLKMPITKIREVAGTDKRGTNAYGVIKAAEKLGFSASKTLRFAIREDEPNLLTAHKKPRRSTRRGFLLPISLRCSLMALT